MDAIGKTDLGWFRQLHRLEPTPERVNFWTPTDASWTRTDAWSGLALSEEEVRLGPYGPAAKSSRGSHRLEEHSDDNRMLPEARPEASEGSTRSPSH